MQLINYCIGTRQEGLIAADITVTEKVNKNNEMILCRSLLVLWILWSLHQNATVRLPWSYDVAITCDSCTRPSLAPIIPSSLVNV